MSTATEYKPQVPFWPVYALGGRRPLVRLHAMTTRLQLPDLPCQVVLAKQNPEFSEVTFRAAPEFKRLLDRWEAKFSMLGHVYDMEVELPVYLVHMYRPVCIQRNDTCFTLAWLHRPFGLSDESTNATIEA